MSHSIQMSLLGGLMIGASASLLMISYGKISGLSGIFSSMLTSFKEFWRWNFFMGFVAGVLIIQMISPSFIQTQNTTMSVPMSIISGLLVGFGTKFGGGCTSGHGVCGISRLSKRSIVATILFMLSAMVVVWIKKQ